MLLAGSLAAPCKKVCNGANDYMQVKNKKLALPVCIVIVAIFFGLWVCFIYTYCLYLLYTHNLLQQISKKKKQSELAAASSSVPFKYY